MGHCDHDAGKRIQIVLKNGHGGNIKIISGLIKKKNIWRLHQNLQKIQSSLLTSGKLLHRGVLHGRIKKKSLKHLGSCDPSFFCRNIFRHLTDIINHSLSSIHIRNVLCKIPDTDRFSDLNLSGIRQDQSICHFKKCGLTAAIWPDDPETLITKNNMIKIIDQKTTFDGFTYMMKLYGFLSHTGLNGIHFHILLFQRGFSRLQCFQTVKPCSLFCTSGTTASCCPFQFHPKYTAALPVTGKLHFLSLRFQLQKSGIISCIGI